MKKLILSLLLAILPAVCFAQVKQTGWTTTTNAATARAALDVYSKSEADARTVNSTNANNLDGLPASAYARTNLASHTGTGLLRSNDYSFLQTSGGWQRCAELIPWRAQSLSTYNDVTNVIQYYRTVGSTFGFNVIYLDFGAYHTNRSATGKLQWNTNAWNGMGPYEFKAFLRTNGFRWMQWYDVGHVPVTSTLTVTQQIADFETILSWAPDIFWADTDAMGAAVMSAMASTNRHKPQLMFGVQPHHASFDPRMIQAGNGFRLHGDTGDPITWARFLEFADVVESNTWQFVGPGSAFFIGPESNYGPLNGGGANGLASSCALQAMWSACFLQGFADTPANAYGPFTTMTNAQLLEIQADPAVVCARRVLMTNDCWVYLKPLKTASGPEFALMLMNTNGASPSTVSLNFSRLNSTAVQSAFYLRPPYSYDVYNLKDNSLVGSGITNLTVTGIATNHFEWFKLVPASKGPVTVDYTPGMLDVATSAGWSRITHEDYYGPFGPGGAYARDGWRIAGSGNSFVYMTIPEWARTITVNSWIGCNAVAWWTNVVSVDRHVFSGSAIDGVAINVPIQGTNGLIQVSYTIQCAPAGTGPRYLVENWAPSTNTTAVRMILGSRKVTFQ